MGIFAELADNGVSGCRCAAKADVDNLFGVGRIGFVAGRIEGRQYGFIVRSLPEICNQIRDDFIERILKMQRSTRAER